MNYTTMSTYGGGTAQADLVRGTVAEVKSLTVDRLKRVLRQESLPVSGIKNELQIRLIAYIEHCGRLNEQETLTRIRNGIRNVNSYGMGGTNPYPSPYSNHTPTSSASPQYNNSPTPRLPFPNTSFAMPNGNYAHSRMNFKDSPFYNIQRPLTSSIELKAREQTRDTARVTVNLDQQLATLLTNDSSQRVMVFCAAETFESAYKPLDVSFPHHAELKCNQEEVKANLKGLKNKPGTTRPVDVTPLLRKKANFPNSIELIYALTTKDKPHEQKFYLIVNLVQKKSVDTLVADLRKGKFLSKERVINDMLARAKDDDIVATSSNMSLKDPVQMTRIETPCRSANCKHNECFDAASFLALQEQATQWSCPICSKPAPWNSLVFDQFVEDILNSTPRNVEQVTVEPDGTWHILSVDEDDDEDENDENSINKPKNESNDDSDYEIVEITDTRPSNSTASSFRMIDRTPSVIRTPPLPHQDFSFVSPPSTSTPTTNNGRTSNKRPREDVIDLTLSDDDEEQPPTNRIKRPSLSSAPSDSSRPGTFEPFGFRLPPPPTYWNSNLPSRH